MPLQKLQMCALLDALDLRTAPYPPKAIRMATPPDRQPWHERADVSAAGMTAEEKAAVADNCMVGIFKEVFGDDV